MKTMRWILFACSLFIAGPRAHAELPQAAQVLKETGVSAGLAVVVGTTDGALEAELTNEGKMLVQGLALSDEAALKARQHIFGKRLYGLASVSVVKTVTTLPYYDRLVNLLVADLDALGKDAPSKEEIDRVLGYEGVAYLKRDGKWTKSVLKTPPEVDSWTHYHYDASCNAVSQDRVVGPPNAYRWLDGPFLMNLVGGFRTSDGVAVQINPAYSAHRDQPKIAEGMRGVRLWARDAQSGVMLWHRPVLPERAQYTYAGTYTETFVAAGGRVYIYDFLDAEKVALISLNLRSGVVERVFDQGVVCRKADWPGSTEKNADWRKWASERFAWSMVLAHDGKVVQMVRDRIVVMDAASGNIVWRKQAPQGLQYLRAIIVGDRLVAQSAKVEYGQWGGGPAGNHQSRKMDLVAVEAWQWKDGAPLWRADISGLSQGGGHDALFHQGMSGCEPHVLLPHGKGLRLMSAKDGSTIWENATGNMIGYHIIGDRIFLGHGGTPVFGGVLMRATGQSDPTPRNGGTNQSACDAPSATVNWFMGKRNFVPVQRKEGWPHWVAMRCFGKKCGEKAACSYGSVFGLASFCGCDQFIRGSGACYAIKPVRAVPDAARLVQRETTALGPVAPQTESLKGPTAAFWERPEGLSAYWWNSNFRGGTDFRYWTAYGTRQTEPAKAGDLTLRAHVNEHRLAAMRDGKEVWNFVANARIGCPPVVYKDLAIFGGHDGCVYAVKLADGAPAWRFLAAPADLRHMVIGQLESAWPVFGVLLDGDKLYCSAGRHEELDGGIHFYCLDAASGGIQWHVVRRRGMESNFDEYRRRKNHTATWVEEDAARGVLTPWVLKQLKEGKQLDGRAQVNGQLALRDGQLWLNDMPMADLAAPKDDIMYLRTLVPPQLVGADGIGDVKALITALGDDDWMARVMAASQLGAAGVQAHQAVPALRTAVSDRNTAVRAAAVRAIADIGAIEPALPELLAAARDPQKAVHEPAGEALGRIGAPALPGLVAVLGDGNPTVARNAASALGRGDALIDVSTVPTLMTILKADSDETRTLCEQAAAMHGDPKVGAPYFDRQLNARLRGNPLVSVLARTGEPGLKAADDWAKAGDRVVQAYAQAVRKEAEEFKKRPAGGAR
jgi:outer membrane protein assembly factor BamB